MATEDEQAVADTFESLEGMDLPISVFVEAFQTNPSFVRKVSITTGLSQDALKSLSSEELKEAFEEFDADASGSISFDEFIKGLTKLRAAMKEVNAEVELNDAEDVIDAAAIDACQIFNDADFARKGELDLQAFMEALTDEVLVQRVSTATKLPTEFFTSLTAARMLQLFKDIDRDGDGKISFKEWVDALVQIRIATYKEEKEEQEDAMKAVMKHAEAALEQGDDDWSGEFDIYEFITAFKTNPKFLRKVSLATDIPAAEFRALAAQDIEELFQSLDTDYSGTVSFEEFVKGLVQIRIARKHEKDQEEAAEEAAALDEAMADAADAFKDADFGYSGELDLQSFMQALCDPAVVEKVSYATKVPVAWFASLSMDQMVEMFKDIDADASGTVSFNEWVIALVRVRQATYQEEKALVKQETEAITKLAEEALDEGDDDWSGELDFREFIVAFRTNPRFLRKVALATEVPVDDFKNLADEDLEDLFNSLDTDFSGTINFDEFVRGLVEIRLARRQQKAEEAEMEEQAVMDAAYMDAFDAFAEADLGVTGELDLEGFHKAMSDEAVIEKVAYATKVPLEFFKGLGTDQIKETFQQIDTDCSGTVSFYEWVSALIKTRQATYLEEKAAQQEAMASVMKDAEAALDDADEDFSGEFELDEFLKAFKTNEVFLRKVSHATGVPAEDFRKLQDIDITELFAALDTDFSGTVSFDEFVAGLVEIRLAKQAGLYDEPTPAQQAQEVKDVVSKCSAVVKGGSLKKDDFVQMMTKLDSSKWSPERLEKLMAAAPAGDDGRVALAALVDFVF